MSAEVETMFSYKEVPWHKSGRILLIPPASVEEAMSEAELNWEVELSPAYTTWRGKVTALKRNAVVRTSDGSILGVVGPGYHPIQNRTSFSFLDEAVKRGVIRIETAGSLRGGKNVWMLASLQGCETDIVKNDAVKAYFLLSNSHDGSFTLRMGFTKIRVVCWNTLSEAMGGDLLRIRHTESAAAALEELKDIVDWKKKEFFASAEKMRALARKGVVEQQIREYVKRVFEPEVKKTTVVDEDTVAKLDKVTAQILPLFEKGRGNDLPGVRGTMWGAYNAVTEYFTWEKGRSADTRLHSLWFGDNAKINARAFTEALKMAA